MSQFFKLPSEIPSSVHTLQKHRQTSETKTNLVIGIERRYNDIVYIYVLTDKHIIYQLQIKVTQFNIA